MITIISDAQMQDTLQKMFGGMDADGFVVQLEGAYDGHYLQDAVGIIKALEVAPQGRPVLMLGWQKPSAYTKMPAWHAALGYPNVSFALLPITAEELKPLLVTSERCPDPLAIRLVEVESRGNSMGVLNHDLGRALKGNGREDWMRRARVLLGNHSDDELIRMVQENERPKVGPFSGQVFPDVCVDVEGTLLDEARNLREATVQKVTQLAQGRPVTVWTGGDVAEIGRLIRERGIEWKLASKYSLAGARVHAIIDDLPADQFTSDYNVDCDVYVQV